MSEIMEKLKKFSGDLTSLHHIMALLQWDQEVYMPVRAARDRADQVALLSAIIHRKEVSEELGELLKKAAGEENLTIENKALVRVMKRSYDLSTKLPEEFVTEFAQVTSRALHEWVHARQKSDFSLFEKRLAEVVGLSKQQAEYLGYTDEPYDALLDIHEEGLTTKRVDGIFAGLKRPLVKLVQEITADPQTELDFSGGFERRDQVRFAEKALAAIGYDFERGRQDVSAHPFSTSLGHHDRRVTNRYNPKSIEFIFSALHEGGHAMYEQGISEDLQATSLDTGISLGIHESQSRLWENIIGRSLPFWKYLYPDLQKAFPGQFAGMSVEEFVKGVNFVKPGFIRVEADEVTYNLHVLIRFELEKSLLRGDIDVHDLPELWNAKYREYLGIEVDSDANGVLQDVHWAHGAIGYFPTYTIGNLASAQIWATFTKDEPDYETLIEAGKLDKIRDWLTEKIYRHGSIYMPEDLLINVTGGSLNPQFFLDYLKNKYLN